jgi:carbamoyl-phosphate synthase large subunit
MTLGVLVSSAGRRTQLLQCFRESAKELGIGLRIVATDMNPALSAACFSADKTYAVPRCTDQSFISALVDICRREQIKLIVPTIDTELPVLSASAGIFSEIGATVSVSATDVIALAGDKQKTAAACHQAGVNAPKTLSGEDYCADHSRLSWPVIVKPRGGSSSINVVRPNTAQDAVKAAMNRSDMIVQELWVGQEYTVNMFFDRSGKMKCAVPHWRIETRAGEVSKGRTTDIGVLREAASKLAHLLTGARGALCFQAIVKENGSYAVFEINARFGGGYPLAHEAGARFTTWLLEESAGLLSSACDKWRAGVTMLRYDAAVFNVD